MVGCWLHFAQTVYRMHLRLRMLELIDTYVEAGWVLHMPMSLALLPAERISIGLEVVRHYVRVHNLYNELRALLGYFDNYWIRTVGVENFSVYRQTHRTNNALEGSYSTLLRAMGPHPGAWNFHDQLRRIELSNWQDLQRLQNNVQPVRQRPRVYQLQDTNIMMAQTRLERGVYNEAQFLHRMAYCTLSLTKRALREHRAPVVPQPDRHPAAPEMAIQAPVQRQNPELDQAVATVPPPVADPAPIREKFLSQHRLLLKQWSLPQHRIPPQQ